MGLERLLEETPEAYYWIGFLMADGCIQSESCECGHVGYNIVDRPTVYPNIQNGIIIGEEVASRIK